MISGKRRRLTISERLAVVRNVKRRVDVGESIRSACRTLNIIPKQFREWTRLSTTMMAHKNSHAKSTAAGPTSIVKEIEEPLLKFIFELREQGFAVSISTIVLQASRLMPAFNRKSELARYQSVRRWIKTHSLVHRMGTHESQRSPSETSGMALDYVQTIRPRLVESNRHQDFILNMDQTPVPFTFNSKKTLESVGQRTVHIRKSTDDTKRVTCAMTVSASGIVLTPLLVFKGAPNGRIEKKEFSGYPSDMIYACQRNAWMDERVMHLWIDKVLKPYVDQAPPGVVPLLLLDSYRCHMMKATVNRIEDLGVEVDHIPGGCTSLCQPVDVGVNKPFKTRLRKLWEEWMISTGLNNAGKISPPTRKDIAEWCCESSQDLPAQMVMNAWRHGVYSYFPPPVQEDDEQHAAVVANNVHTADDDSSSVSSGSNYDDEDSSSGSSDDDSHRDEVGQSEPLLSPCCRRRCHATAGTNKNDVGDVAGTADDGNEESLPPLPEPLPSPSHRHRAQDEEDDNDMDGEEDDASGTDDDENDEDSLPPPLPDTLELARVLQQVWEEQQE